MIDVPKEILSKITKERAVDLVRDLVDTDARDSNIPLDIISFSSETDTADGGIDGKVNGSDKKSKMGTIKKGLTCYQVKSGGQGPIPSTIKKILRTNNGKGEIKPGIKNCFDEDGTLVIVFTGVDTPIHKINEIYENLNEYLPEYENPHLEIWVQDNLRRFLKSHPRLSLKILKINAEWFCSYQEWASQEYMNNRIFLGPAQEGFIDGLKRRLPRKSTEHIRVTGEPGIGKTRLVLEALRADLADSCWYIDNSREFLASDLFRYITTKDDKSPAVLVVDECDESEMVEIWNRVKHIPQISLITIYNEPGSNMRDMVNLEVPPLEDKQIIEILELYIPSYHADIWYKECRPSPRAAHIIGENLSGDTGDVLQSPSDIRVWDRYIASRVELDGPEFKERKKILLWLSLFKKFGERESSADEYKTIEKMLEDKAGISPATLSQTITKLKRMKILQGSFMLYITPKVLHVWLWREWHKKYDDGLFPRDEMADNAKSDTASSNVLAWHMDMLRYAEDTQGASSITNNLFKPNGFADRHALLDSHAGADLFYSASKADPEKAVDYLNRHVSSKGWDGLVKFDIGRRQAAMVLTEAAMNSRLFERSAHMLLLLAGTESSQGFSDTDRSFVSLFSPAPGPVARTAMPPSGRLSLLAKSLDSDMPECRLLGIDACKAALQTRDFVGDIDEDEAWQRVKPWMPKFRSEYTEYYAGVLDIIRGHLERLEVSERSKLVEAVLSRTRDLLAVPELHDAVLSLLDMIHAKQYADNEPIIEAVSNCLEFERDNMPKDLRKNLELLRDRITGSSYGALLKRYVSMNIVSDLQDEDGVRQKTISALAEQSLDVKILEPELDWLVTDKAIHGHGFGYALGRIDGGALFLRIRDAQRRHGESKAVFLGGYLNAAFHRSVDEWESLMDSLVMDDIIYPRVPALTHMSGMTDRAAIRIRDLVKSGLAPTVLRDFVSGTLVRDMSEERFEEWLQLLADGYTETYKIALNLYHKYYIRGNIRIPDSARELLFPSNTTGGVQHVYGQSAYFWSGILVSYVKQNPDEMDTVRKALKTAMSTDYMHGSLRDEVLPALVVAAERNPAKIWEMIVNFIDPAENRHSAYLNVRRLLSRSGAALMDKISLEVIFKWIDEDKKKRAPFVAYMIPNDINTATKLAVRYGKINRVTRILIENLNSEMIRGPISKYYEEKIKTVDSLMEKESDTTALVFLQGYRDVLADLRNSDWPPGL